MTNLIPQELQKQIDHLEELQAMRDRLFPPGLMQELQRFQRELAPIQRAVEEASKFMAAANAVAVTPELLERIAATEMEIGQKALAAAEAGWTLPMFVTPGAFFDLVEGIGASADLDARYVAFYEENGGEMLTVLSGELRSDLNTTRWAGLVDECISSVRDSRYKVALPALISVCEGMLAALTDSRATNPLRPIQALCDEIKNADVGEFHRAHITSIRTFIERLFGFANFTAERPPSINRHWILHGRDRPDQWTKVDALKLLQAVHTIASYRKLQDS